MILTNTFGRQMHTVFSPHGHVLYGFLKYFEEEGPRKHVRKYKHMFRTVDAVTYTDIATVELKDNVADLFVSPKDDVIAVMETAKDGFGGLTGTTCRLYEVYVCFRILVLCGMTCKLHDVVCVCACALVRVSPWDVGRFVYIASGCSEVCVC